MKIVTRLLLSRMKQIGIGLAGLGTVGSGVWNILRDNGSLIESRTGEMISCKIKKIAVRNLEKAAALAVPKELCTNDLLSIIDDDSVDIVVELIGGTDAAFDLVSAALKAGKPVVTGNKALLAERGAELFALAKECRQSIHFEGAVAGGIPIIKAIQSSLIGNKIQSFVGIINGTSNYILERMTLAHVSYEEALEEAQRLGYAEADPTLDVNGWDAAHKAILLTSLAHGFMVDAKEVYVRGIDRVRSIDIRFAEKLGYSIKQLCVMKTHQDGSIELRAQPSFIPRSHILSHVNGVFNAIAIKGDAIGDALFYGRGAGQMPTGSAVVADILEVAENIKDKVNRGFQPYKSEGKLMQIGETETPYYVRFKVEDRPGVIAEIATVFAKEGIGISGTHSPVNPDFPDQEFIDMVFLLHTCKFKCLTKTLHEVETLKHVKERPTLFRIESFA
jgi:homoserine dehydrogenase